MIDAGDEGVVAVGDRGVRGDVVDGGAEGAVGRWEVAEERLACGVDSAGGNLVVEEGRAVARAACDGGGIVDLDSCSGSADSGDEVGAEAGEVTVGHGREWDEGLVGEGLVELQVLVGDHEERLVFGVVDVGDGEWTAEDAAGLLPLVAATGCP